MVVDVENRSAAAAMCGLYIMDEGCPGNPCDDATTGEWAEKPAVGQPSSDRPQVEVVDSPSFLYEGVTGLRPH